MTRRVQGFTLIELLVALASASVLALLSWPSMQGQLVHARRADATAALSKLQIAQERHRSLYGVYAADLPALGSPGLSPEGLYQIELRGGNAESYQVVARALAHGPQAGDSACGEITLQVAQGFASAGPSSRCWNR